MTPQPSPAVAAPAAKNRSIIADPRSGQVWRAVGVLAGLVGVLAAAHYAGAELTLSHYDAKGHLVVARRILDSLNPGWVQIGAVWLPLPHLLNMLPVQVDVLYRTGLSGVAISVLSFAVTAALLYRLICWATGSHAAAAVSAAVFMSSPDVLYLQSTPMTEPLLMALITASVWTCLHAWGDPTPARVRLAGLIVAGACLTRYEAWPVTAALLVLGGVSLAWQGVAVREAARQVFLVARYPAWAVAGFLVLGKASTGAWFTTSGFFVPENIATGRPVKAVLSVWWGAHELTSYAIASLGLAGFVLAVVAAARARERRGLLVLLALAAAGLLPAYAFYAGHPFRIRYMVPLLPAIAAGIGLFVGLVPAGAWRIGAFAVSIVVLGTGTRPLDPTAPMVVEAQWDRPNRLARQAVTAYLVGHWDRGLVLASMGSLAHYMQELSSAGFALRDFLHEGNGEIWDAASEDPGTHVGWVLMEEQAEGGDVLAQRARARPHYLAGFDRVAAGGGVVLYRRTAAR